MIRCLRDRTLLLLYDGEGTSAQRTHLTECETCAARYRQLKRDLESINHTLRELPPPKTASIGFHPVAFRWAPTAVALTLALAMIWGGVEIWNRSGRPPLRGIDNGETWSILDEIPTNLFLLKEAMAVESRTEAAGSYDLAAAALEIDRPCEWYDLPARGEMESAIEEIEIFGGVPFPSCVEINQGPGRS